MSFSGPTKNCPRCNTLLPADARFCGTCGMQFSTPAAPAAQSASPGTNYGPTQFGGQSGPGGWPQSQPPNQPPSQPTFQSPSQPSYQPPGQPWQPPSPGYTPQSQPGYGSYPQPQGPASPLGYAPAAVAPAPKKSKTGLIVIILIIAVVLIGGGTAGFFYLRGHTTSPSSPLFDRHSLPGNVPLPDNVTFVSMKTVTESSGGISITYNIWYWTVSNSGPASVQQFYKDQLPSNGWTHVQSSGSSGDTLSVDACQGTQQALSVGVSQHLQDINPQGTPTGTVDAPSGGSTLGIALTSSPELIRLLCSGA